MFPPDGRRPAHIYPTDHLRDQPDGDSSPRRPSSQSLPFVDGVQLDPGQNYFFQKPEIADLHIKPK